MIHEVLMNPGSFDLTLKATAPWSLVRDIEPYGHIVITETRVDPNKFSDAAMLDMSRYTGVILGAEFESGNFVIRGAGLAWWLGDTESAPDVYETKVSFSGSTLENAIDTLLPDVLTLGAVSEPADGSTFTGEFQLTSPLSAIRTVCETLNCEFYISPDGLVDAGPAEFLFATANPKVVVTTPETAGSDPTYDSAPVRFGKSTYDARPYVTKVVAAESNPDGSKSVAGSTTVGVASTYKDLNGNTFARVAVTTASLTDTTDIGEYTASILEDRDEILWEQEVEVEGAESGTLRVLVGDALWVYDPPTIVDRTNQIRFRGDLIYPRKLRLLQASFGVTDGMGVYYRTKDGAYSQLSRWVEAEV